jgi:hypothetical protein
MIKKSDLPLYQAVKNEFSKAILNKEGKIYKDAITKKLRGHDILYKKTFKDAQKTIVSCVWIITEDFLREEPPILIVPFPSRIREYEGWQIYTEKTKIDEVSKEIRIEKYMVYYRRLNNLLYKIEREKLADKKLKILPALDIKKIQAKQVKGFKIIKYDYEERDQKDKAKGA